LDFSQLLFIDQPLPQGPNSEHEAIHRMGIMAVPGGRLLVLDGLHPGGKLRQLAPGSTGTASATLRRGPKILVYGLNFLGIVDLSFQGANDFRCRRSFALFLSRVSPTRF
jgi:hypothetical protein